MISKDQKQNIICTKVECRESFYGRNTAQPPAVVITNNNKSLDDDRVFLGSSFYCAIGTIFGHGQRNNDLVYSDTFVCSFCIQYQSRSRSQEAMISNELNIVRLSKKKTE